MSAEQKSRLHKSITIPEMDIPLSLLFDLKEFAYDKVKEAKIDCDLLESALETKYITYQPFSVRHGIQTAINEADFERSSWRNIYSRLARACDDALNE